MSEVSDKAYKNFERKRVIDGHTVILPKPPPKKDIANYYKAQHLQKFTKIEFPSLRTFTNLNVKEQEQLFDQWTEWLYYGYWFMNNGKLEYITGVHWFYLNCFYGEGSDIYFVDSDRDFFYLWEMVDNSDEIVGMLYGTNRRDGKTQKGLCIELYLAITSTRSNFGMQENDEEAAEGMFLRLVNAWQNLPFFLQPVHSGSTRPKTKLEFFAPSMRGKDAEIVPSLRNWIDFRSSEEGKYDKTKLRFILHDEIGKAKKIDVNSRYNRVRECLFRGKTMVGKYLGTTTVEDETDEFGVSLGINSWGLKNFHKLWFRSKPYDHTGRTESKLITYFKPAYFAYEGFIDEYGYSMIEEAKAYIEKERSLLEGDDLFAYIRKYPFNEEEFFSAAESTTDFNFEKVKDQMEWNAVYVNAPHGDLKIQRYNLEWVDRQYGGQVTAVPHPEGAFFILAHPEYPNKRLLHHGLWRPAFAHEGVIGCDPIGHSKKKDTRSKYAMIGRRFKPKNSMYPSLYDNAIDFIYLNRFDDPVKHHDDALKAAIYYGREVLFENNIYAGIAHFKDRGFIGYAAMCPKELAPSKIVRPTDIGVATHGEKNRNLLLEYVKRDIIENCGLTEDGQGRIYFNEVLTQIKGLFEDRRGEWNKYDLAVAHMMCLAKMYSVTKKRVYVQKEGRGLMDFYTGANQEFNPYKNAYNRT